MAGCHIPASYVLVLFLTYSSTNCLIYHIIPSPNAQCPTSTWPCLTLSQLQFAPDTETYFWSNTTLIFEPGTHSLDSTIIRIGNLSSLSFLKSALLVNVRIVCRGYSNFYMYNITFVHILGLDLIGCSSKGESVDHISIEETNIFGQKNSSTALELIGSSAIVERSFFDSNVVGKAMGISLRSEHQNVYVGGAIALIQSDITLIDSTFTQNSAEVGGAMFGDSDSNVTIINSIFERNHATSLDSHTECYGGALYCQNGCTMTIQNSTFNSNSVVRNSGKDAFFGGAIAVRQAKVEIRGCTFSNNSAAGYGGVMHIWESIVSISNYSITIQLAGTEGQFAPRDKVLLVQRTS